MRQKHEQCAKFFAIAIISQFFIAQNAPDLNRQTDILSFACGFNGLKINFFIFWLANCDKFNLD